MASTTDEHWHLLDALFAAGVRLPATERADWLAALTIAPELREQLEQMLSADAGPDTLSEQIEAAFASELPEPELGSRIGAWRLVEQIGSGGMGSVYRVERVEGGFTQQAALKLIRGFVTAGAVQQLRHERQILADLRHPGIARLLDGGETGQGQPYLVIEHIRGQPITQAADARRLGRRERIRLLVEVARAVQHAHQKLIVHCDIKPANVLLQDDGRPVLLDFGIAALLLPGAAQAAVGGWFTPGYSSPEQRSGKPPSTATDVYALGLLLAELLHRRDPTDGAAARRADRAPDEIDRIVDRACAVIPSERYASAAEFADDLERFLARRPVRAVPQTRRYVFGKWLLRHRIAAVLTAAMLAALLVLGARLVIERDRAIEAERIVAREAQTARASAAFLVDLFRQAEPARSGNRALTAAELVEHGIRRLATDQQIGDEQRATLLVALGTIQYHLGLPNAAAAVMADAIAVARKSGDRRTLADALDVLGRAQIDRGRADDAERLLAEAHALYLQAGEPRRASSAQIYLGIAQNRRGAHADAERTLAAARNAWVVLSGPASPDVLMLDVYQTEVLRETGRETEAIERLERLLPRLESSLSADHPDLFVARGKLVHLLLRVGRRAEAQQVLETLLGDRDRLYAHDSAGTALLHNSLGALYHQQGRVREALEQTEAALAVQRRILGEEDPALAIGLNNIATLYREIGDYQRALPPLRRAVAITEAASQARPAVLALFRQHLGLALLLHGEADAARALLELPIDGDGVQLDAARTMREVYLADWHRRHGTLADARTHLDAALAARSSLPGNDVRVADMVRLAGLLAAADGDRATAVSELQSARSLAVTLRGERTLRIAELDLDLAELALAERDFAEARIRIAAAEAVIDAIAADQAPQRFRLARLVSRLPRD